MVIGSYFVSLLPLPVRLWLGNGGNHYFAPLALLLLPITFGLVCMMWLLLRILLWPLQYILRLSGRYVVSIVFGSNLIVRFYRRREDTASRRPRTAILSMLLIFLVIFILVPWQVAFLGCWLIHFYTCASSLAGLTSHASATGTEAVPLAAVSGDGSPPAGRDDGEHRSALTRQHFLVQQTNAHLHLLLFMTWLLPLAAPVLAVWVRTLATAGLTTPFDGDHNFLYVAPFLVLVEVLSGGDASAHARAFL